MDCDHAIGAAGIGTTRFPFGFVKGCDDATLVQRLSR